MSHAPILTRIAFIILIASAATPAHAGYPDGLNTYAGYHIMHGGVDPSGFSSSPPRRQVTGEPINIEIPPPVYSRPTGLGTRTFSNNSVFGKNFFKLGKGGIAEAFTKSTGNGELLSNENNEYCSALDERTYTTEKVTAEHFFSFGRDLTIGRAIQQIADQNHVLTDPGFGHGRVWATVQFDIEREWKCCCSLHGYAYKPGKIEGEWKLETRVDPFDGFGFGRIGDKIVQHLVTIDAVQTKLIGTFTLGESSCDERPFRNSTLEIELELD